MFRGTKINVYIKLMATLGISAKQLLAKTGITPSHIKNPEGLITREMYHAALRNMMELSKNPGIAFSLGNVLEPGDLGIVGYAMLSSSTLRQVISIWQQYSNPLVGALANIDSALPANSGYEFTLSSSSQFEIFRRFEIEESLVEGMKLVKILTGINPVVHRAKFSYPEPSYSALYKSFFTCPIQFNASKTVIRFLKPSLDSPLSTGNPELYKVCAEHCKEVLQHLPNAGPLYSSLRDLFLSGPGSLPDLHVAASKLGMSESNLRRKLRADGTNYQDLKDQFRLDLSFQLLTSGHMTPKEVAYFLGFTTPSSFYRTFKRWTGQTVREYLRS